MSPVRRAQTEAGTVLAAELTAVEMLAGRRGYKSAFTALRDRLGSVAKAVQRHRGSTDGGVGGTLFAAVGGKRAADALRAALGLARRATPQPSAEPHERR
jgi:class 3 adenylate cyclase